MDSTFTAEEHFRQGLEALHADRTEDALRHFGAAMRVDSGSARFRSHYGLALGLAERRLERALTLCRDAVKQEFFNPVHYHNLARLHLAFGFKAEAIRYLRRGLMIDPANREISEHMRLLGVRRPPPLAFLRRQNVLNRFAGRILRRSRLEPDMEFTAFGAQA